MMCKGVQAAGLMPTTGMGHITSLAATQHTALLAPLLSAAASPAPSPLPPPYLEARPVEGHLPPLVARLQGRGTRARQPGSCFMMCWTHH